MMHRCILLAAGLLALPASANTLDELLDSVKQGQAESRVVNAEREARFVRERDERKQLYLEARNQARQLDRRADDLRERFSANAKEIEALRKRLKEESGDLEQLGTVFRQTAADTQGLLNESLVTIQLPERMRELTRLSRVEGLPAPEDIESLWYELQREMTENGRVQTFSTEYIDAQGNPVQGQVQRFGVFAARAQDQYLRFLPEQRRLEVLASQPGSLLQRALRDNETTVLIDPTRGSLFGLLLQKPAVADRVRQAGVVGVIILVLGAVGVLLGLFQLLYLSVQGRRIRAQRDAIDTPDARNPLGRVLQVARDSSSDNDVETYELAIDEAILKEMPKLERLQGAIKLLAAVAPLLGLLGTVTGMIETFQAITLFGTGDPKLMAGGISQALMTTVLGLVVAIPLLFLHSLVVARARVLIQILDEQSAGLIARRQEREPEPA